MSSNLVQAFLALGVKPVTLYRRNGEVLAIVTPEQVMQAFLSNLSMAGYLSNASIDTAVDYLDAEQRFFYPAKEVKQTLREARDAALINGEFSASAFIARFDPEGKLSVFDCVDIVIFLIQTAFDRKFGQERDTLQAKPWMQIHWQPFLANCAHIGLITPRPPLLKRFDASAIMGAATFRTRTRMKFFFELDLDSSGPVYLMTGQRPLSKGLDEKDVMLAVARHFGVAVNEDEMFVQGAYGRWYLNSESPVTESMMAQYLYQTFSDAEQSALDVVSSDVQTGHWRATTQSNASDVARELIRRLQEGDLQGRDNVIVLMIAEQPFTERMRLQTQAAIDKALMDAGLHVDVLVQGAGDEVHVDELAKYPTAKRDAVVTRVNTAQAALFAVMYTLYRENTVESEEGLRDGRSLMFSSREERHDDNVARREQQAEQQQVTLFSSVFLLQLMMSGALAYEAFKSAKHQSLRQAMPGAAKMTMSPNSTTADITGASHKSFVHPRMFARTSFLQQAARKAQQVGGCIKRMAR